MKKKSSVKKSFLLSIISLLVCVTMLTGTTFAWFTDSVTAGVNVIIAGNLDVELEYASEFNADGTVKTWLPVDENVSLFSDKNADGITDNYWEPGHTETVYLKITNLGTLDLKYKFSVTKSSETSGKDINGQTFKLSDYLVFGQVESDTQITKFANREAAWAAVGDTNGLNTYNKNNPCLRAGQSEYAALVVYMPTSVGNEANYRGTAVPKITLGVSLYAAQAVSEEDTFGNDYDEEALYDDQMVFADTVAKLKSGMSDKTKKLVAVTADLSDVAPITDSLTGVRDYTLDLRDSTVTFNQVRNFGIFIRYSSKTITVTGKEGGLVAKSSVIWANNKNLTVNITGGKFISTEAGAEVIYCQAGTVNISGGFFEITGEGSTAYLLNCYDANYAAGTAKIIVTGGTFVNFDPSDNTAEGAGTSFVADGYTVVSEVMDNGDIWYTVIKA